LFLFDKLIPISSPRPAFPDAEYWPGICKSSDRVSITVNVPAGRTKFNCTGIFESAGEVVEIKLNDAKYLKLGVKVLIGTGDDFNSSSVK
jgi:N-terminal domain of M60-like peptidases